MSFKRKIKRRRLGPSFVPYYFPKKEQIEVEWVEYDNFWTRSLYTPFKETVDRGRDKTYTSEEMFYMSQEEREEIVNAAICRDAGEESGLFVEDMDDDGGILGFCDANKLIIRGYFGNVLQDNGWERSYHEAYLVENWNINRKGLMGIVYFPFSLDDDLTWALNGEDSRLVVLDMELKKAS